MAHTPRVSVVVPCFNAAAYLPETLDSVAAQTLSDLELIVADDGSTDESVSVAKAWAAAHTDCPTRVLELDHAGHPAVPRNAGIEAAAADLVICLDADDLLTPPFLELCVAALDARPEMSIAYTDQQDFGGSDQYHVVPEYDFRTLVNRNFFGICSVFRKQAWLEVGGFDPATRYEDWNFWLACGTRGHFGVKVHGAAWRYRVRGDGRFLSAGVLQDRTVKASFVRRRPGLYDTLQQVWATAVVTGNPLADQVPNTVGTIPAFPSPPGSGPIAAVQASAGGAVPAAPQASGADVRVGPGPSPVVSVVIPAYNLAHYLPGAIDSALGQSGLDGAVEVIVVDDESQDDTPRVIAEYGDRVRSVRQPNAGLRGAIERGLGLATGEFIALLDADDTWPADRLARHVAALRANPNVGLVHGDMVVTNAHGDVVQPSFFALPHMAPAQGRVLGKLIADNFVSGGASTLRAALLPALYPIPPDVAYPDWWIAACIASVAEIRTVDGIANNYRQHGANMGLGVSEAEKPRLLRAELPWRRRLLREFCADPTVTAAELAQARATLQNAIQVAATAEPLGARGVLTPDPAAARRRLERLPRAAVGAPRSKALMQALAEDPFDGAVWFDLDRVLPLEHQLGSFATPAPLIELLQAGPLTIAWLEEVAGDPDLLRSFAAQQPQDAATALVVLVEPAADIATLIRLVDADPVFAGDEVTIRVVTAPATPSAAALLASLTRYRLTRAQSPAPYGTIPPHPAAERPANRDLPEPMSVNA